MSRLVLCLILAACATPPPIEPATLVTTRTGDFFLVACTIDGRGPYHLVLDTGSAWLVLDPSVPHGRAVRSGPIERRGLRTQTRPMDALSKALHVRADGILPYGFFRDATLVIDYPAGEVRVTNERLVQGIGTDASEERPFVEVSLQGRPRRMLVDTGSGVELGVAASEGIEWATEPVDIGRSQTIDGIRVRRAGCADGEARIGDLAFPQPMVEVGVEVPRIGTALLRDIRIRFDQRSRLVQLERRPERPGE